MDADEIVPLSAEAVARLMAEDDEGDGPLPVLGKRRQHRWAFPGTVQLWLPGPAGDERHVLGVCHNLNERGVGVRLEEPVEVGATLNVAIHQPKLSLHGKCTVRHCSARSQGYLCGLEFIFENQ